MSNIYIGIVDDMPVGEFTCPDKISLCGVDCAIQRHVLFASGDWDNRVKSKRIRIESQIEFEKAIGLLKSFSGMGIFFFDYQLSGTEVEQSHIEPFLNQARLLSGKDREADVLNFFNANRQGLFLAMALAVNPNADVDIWLGSGQVGGLADDVGRIIEIKRPKIHVDDFNYSLGRQAQDAAEVRSERIERPLVKFRERRDLPDPGFWKLAAAGQRDDRSGWFLSTQPPVPHNKPALPPHVLVEYLMGLGLDTPTANKWLASRSCYEALKCLIGSRAASDYGKESPKGPSIGCLAFVLLKAVGPCSWADTLDWQPQGTDLAATPVFKSEKLLTRRFIILLYQVFAKLKDEGGKQSEVNAQLLRKSDGVHFLVDFGPGFDCTVGKEPTKPSLSARISRFCFGPPGDGQVTEAIYQWLVASMPQPSVDSLFFAVYPVEINSQMWTRFDFKACR